MNPAENEKVRLLRARTGYGLVDCKKALDRANKDMYLAQGFLRVQGLAVNVRPRNGETAKEAREQWELFNAMTWADYYKEYYEGAKK